MAAFAARMHRIHRMHAFMEAGASSAASIPLRAELSERVSKFSCHAMQQLCAGACMILRYDIVMYRISEGTGSEFPEPVNTPRTFPVPGEDDPGLTWFVSERTLFWVICLACRAWSLKRGTRSNFPPLKTHLTYPPPTV